MSGNGENMIRSDQQPMVSIVMPVYNSEKYLRECLDSLLSQSFTDYEVICVDDESSDDSPAILNEYAAKDRRFMILHQDHAYAGCARNLGMSNARGKYIIFLDSDDRFLPQMLELTVKKAEETDADICVFPAEGFNNRNGRVYALPTTCCPSPLQQGVFSRKDDPLHIFCFTQPGPWNKLFRKDFIIKNGLEFQNTRSVNDLAFILTALAIAERITTLKQPLLQYRRGNSESLQGSQQKEPRAFYQALLEFRKRLQERDLYENLEQAFINQAASDIFYNLHTLRSSVVFEETYDFIKNTVLDEFGLTGHEAGFFYVLPDWQIPERIRIMQDESILDYAVKFHPNLPELKQKAMKNTSLKELIKLVLGILRTKIRANKTYQRG